MAERVRPVAEIAGAFGDVGTLLPLALGALVVADMPATGVLSGFGLAYLITAATYRAPIPVQPMKVAAAVIVTTAPAAGVVAGSGLILGAVFVAIAVSGLVQRLARAIPRLVTAALQVGLGLSLAWLALDHLASAPGLGVGLVAVLAALLVWRPGWPATLVVLGAGIALGPLLGLVPQSPLPPPRPGWPDLVQPSAAALPRAALDIALPQIPLTLTNAILVTAAVGREYFPHARRLDAGRLALTTGVSNIVAAPLGGMPICHGAGGVAAHHRFGARTGWAPALLGLVLLALGVGWGPSATAWLARIPEAALGALLLIPAVDLVRAARPLAFRPSETGVLLAGVALALFSPGLAFLAMALTLALWARSKRRGRIL